MGFLGDKIKQMPVNSIKNIYSRYERYVFPVALLSGFILDNLTLKRIDFLYENLVLISYLLIAGFGIFLLQFYYSSRLKSRFFEKVIFIVPFTLQFAFGGLFSAFVIFYFKSASIFASWPFLLVLLFLLVGNELFKERYSRLIFQISIYFIAIFSYSIFALPILVKKMGSGVFIISGLISLIVITLFIYFLYRIMPMRMEHGRRPLMISISIGIIYLMFNVFYFANLIPPIPLALKDSGIYHNIEIVDNSNYLVQYEPLPWYLFFKKFNPVFHKTPGDRVYCFSAVFAPTEFNMKVFHRWSFFDEKADKWVETDRIYFNIIGGRAGGYRGYTFKSGLEPGKWRVDIITEQDQVLGRTKFKIEKVDSHPQLKEVLR